MDILHSIIHAVIKEKDTHGPDCVQVKSRDKLLPVDERLNKLGLDILKLYGSLSNGYGMLGKDFAQHRFPRFLSEFNGDDESFVDLSEKTISLIAEAMSGQRFATTSYPVFIRYTRQGREWLLIAVLKLKEGVGLDESTLDLNDSLSFDVTNLREAARIDIQKWVNDEQPYLSFIKRGSGSDAESSRYFRSALSCLEYTDAKFNTDATLRAMGDYCESQKYDAGRKQVVRSAVYDYLKDKKVSGEPANLTSLSAYFDDQNPESFVNFVREGNYGVNETFSPHPASYRRLQRLRRKFRTISLGFDVAELYSEQVAYDSELQAILLKEPPEDLITEIRSLQEVQEEEQEETQEEVAL
ncbi:nucleoid-associated protein [Microbulbifer sp. ZKSA004]|uniref:nucleoid-associated protein n=1 Tax=Microbulbifer sp. ZKSA004 TaxID=3243389 RepID=UPI0040394BC7